MKSRTVACFLFLVFIITGGNANERGPVAVSPGSERGVAVVGQGCPTFSWTAVSWATAYKVVVFEAVSTEVLTYEEMEAMGSPVLSEEIRGPALSWTPSADERLRNGGEYVWYVQAVDVSGIGVWSEGKHFKVEVAVRLAGVEEKVRERLMEYGVDEEVITEVFEDVKSELKEVVLWGVDTQGSQGRTGIQGTESLNNTFYGLGAGTSTISTGTKNTFIGFGAGYGNVSGDNNTFVGHAAGYNSTANANTFIGMEAGLSNTTGYYNTFIGYYAGRQNTTGSSNSFIGRRTGRYNITGSQNTFVGESAGYYSTGHSNVFLGYRTGYNETGSNKLYIDNSDTASPLVYGEFDNNILAINGKLGIGTQSPGAIVEAEGTGSAVKLWLDRTDGATAEVVAKANNITFGSRTNHGIQFSVNSITRMHIDTNGDVGIGVTDATYPLEMGGGAYCTGTNWVDVSSREYKENITDLDVEEAFEALEGLNPVRFNYKRNAEEDYVGFIAEDVPELVATKDRKGISTMDVVAVLTKVVREQQRTDEEQKKLIQDQRKAMQEQREMNKKQQKIIKELLERIEALEKEK